MTKYTLTRKTEEPTYPVLMSETEARLFSDYLEEREYGFNSKALWLLSPGAYEAKEAASYGYDNKEDYKKDRKKYALLGAFTPITSTVVKKNAEKMAKSGKYSKEEIKEYLENPEAGRYIAGRAEAVFGVGGTLGRPIARVVSVHDKLHNQRAEWRIKNNDFQKKMNRLEDKKEKELEKAKTKADKESVIRKYNKEVRDLKEKYNK